MHPIKVRDTVHFHIHTEIEGVAARRTDEPVSSPRPPKVFPQPHAMRAAGSRKRVSVVAKTNHFDRTIEKPPSTCFGYRIDIMTKYEFLEY